MRIRRMLALVAALVVVLGAGGCARANPTVVAYVGSAEITQVEVERSVSALNALGAGAATRSDVISALIQGEIAEQVAVERQIAITDSDRDAAIRSTNLAAFLDDPNGVDLARAVANIRLVAQKLGDAAFLAELTRRPVTLNPRYGALDPETKGIAGGSSGSLSVPAAQRDGS